MRRVAVVGAGIVGATIAWRLGQRGFTVDLYDGGAFAGEASAAGAGMLAPGGEANELSAWARDTVQARAMYADFVTELQDSSGHRIDFRECGAVDLALNQDDWEALRRRSAVLEQLGVKAESISAAELTGLAPALSATATRGDYPALWFAGDAVVNPRDITHALAHLLPQLGVTIHEHCAISACTWQGTHFQLRSASAGIVANADSVVMAAGAWTGAITWGEEASSQVPPPRVAVPIRGHLIQCQQPPGTLGPIVRHQHLYVFQRESGAVISGSNEECVDFDRTPNQEAVLQIHKHTEQLLPGLFPPRTDTYWLGFRPGIRGSGPEVRRLGELPLWLAYGHYRNGILLAPHTAERIVNDLVAATGGNASADQRPSQTDSG